MMYTLENTDLLNRIYHGYISLDDIHPDGTKSETKSIQNEIGEIFETTCLDMQLMWIEEAQMKIVESYETFLANIKTFNSREFDTIYCEREWRTTENFKFDINDIAIIILPNKEEGIACYDGFLREISLPRTVTVARWEDLVEH